MRLPAALPSRDRQGADWRRGAWLSSAAPGSRTITFEVACNRAAYLPRTSAPKSDSLYSGRRVPAPTLLAFLIDLPLRARCLAGGDDSNRVVLVRCGTPLRRRPEDAMPNVTKRISSHDRGRCRLPTTDQRTRSLLRRRVRRAFAGSGRPSGHAMRPRVVYAAR